MAWQPGCTVSWLQPPYCEQECARCIPDTTCKDVPPDSSFTCAQQVRHGHCRSVSTYAGHVLSPPPQLYKLMHCWTALHYISVWPGHPSQPTFMATEWLPVYVISAACTPFSYILQRAWGQCNQSWMQGFCNRSCGRCATFCTDYPPPGTSSSCPQQVCEPIFSL